MPVHLSLDQVHDLSLRALTGSGASRLQAGPVADSMRDAEAEGIRRVGLGYLPTYCEHLRCGKVVGDAVPVLRHPAPGALVADAAFGFAHPAFEAARAGFAAASRTNGTAALAITRSYAAGVIGWFVDRLARDGLVSLAFANSPPAIAPWGGKKAFFGTNPFAFGLPRPDGRPPLIIDQSSSVTAKVNVINAAASDEPIPEGWALDPDGNPTTDAKLGLAGSMAPAGGYKGATLALVVDLMAAAMTGAHFSFQASSFGDNTGGPPGTGQFFIAMDPERFVDGREFADRVETVLGAMLAQEGVRLPGDRRHAHRQEAETAGIELPEALHQRLLGYAAS